MGNRCCGSSSAIANDENALKDSLPKRRAAKTRAASDRTGKAPLRTSITKAAPAAELSPATGAVTAAPGKMNLTSTPPLAPQNAPTISVENLVPGGPSQELVRSLALQVSARPGVGAGRALHGRPTTTPTQRIHAGVYEEPVTDTFQISATTASDAEEEDCFSVDVSQPTHSVMLLERPGHLRTFSDVTSEVDFTATSLDRPRAERVSRGLTTRDLIAMEAERRARIERAAQTSRRSTGKALCKQQVMHERAAMLQRFFVERLALQLWQTIGQEAVTRAQLLREERAGAHRCRQLQCESLVGGWAACHPSEDNLTSVPATALKGSSQSSRHHAWDASVAGTRGNGVTTEDVDLTSSASYDEEDGNSLLQSDSRAMAQPPSVRITSPFPAPVRASTAPADGSERDDLNTTFNSSRDRSASRRPSPVAVDPRRALRERCVARVGNVVSGSRQQ